MEEMKRKRMTMMHGGTGVYHQLDDDGVRVLPLPHVGGGLHGGDEGEDDRSQSSQPRDRGESRKSNGQEQEQPQQMSMNRDRNRPLAQSKPPQSKSQSKPQSRAHSRAHPAATGDGRRRIPKQKQPQATISNANTRPKREKE